MVNLNGNDYKSWQDYFKSIFAVSKEYERIAGEIHNKTLIEKYVPIDKSNKTEITVGYLDETLIYLNYNNPQTPGFNKLQEQEYFYRYDFTPGKMYGNPGLEFIDINVQEIDKQLHQGAQGKEVQYYKNGQLIRSEIFFKYDDKLESVPVTFYFIKRSFCRSLLDLFKRPEIDNQMTIKNIDLNTVFSGLKQ